jgi:hypothetical protein
VLTEPKPLSGGPLWPYGEGGYAHAGGRGLLKGPMPPEPWPPVILSCQTSSVPITSYLTTCHVIHYLISLLYLSTASCRYLSRLSSVSCLSPVVIIRLSNAICSLINDLSNPVGKCPTPGTQVWSVSLM